MFKPLTKKQAEKILEAYDARMEVLENGEPIRTVFNGRRNRPVSLYPSVKCDRMIASESYLERRAIRWLEVDSDVVSYMDQPHTLHFTFNGKQTRYTPDFGINRNRHTTYLEVKYRRDLFKMEPDERKRLKRARAIYRSIGSNLEFFTDLRLKVASTWHENAIELEKARRLSPSPAALASLIAHLETIKESSLQDCAGAMSDPDLGAARVMALALRRIVRLQLDQPLGSQTIVTLEDGYRLRIKTLRSA
ncbi:hypothetical protein GCM10008171_28730 [Methylopila jiangsuensis]|uniref:TnsA endonuclease N-terminal domain-containing protein n=1 Tax=Methylopila jiangsuensis TaxID=586230 RepID=A0A9W6N411_9HYPH|nr:TnsA endonuclease N-terminal domain-containing protein [Methylopila jiangsuensis]MDR6284992.1 hypothetical protein [Methylopila jiangsuensis]GLK77619.1 hypothetical protein GCM10008171_28730 [Methylopila jiangsuensis]